MAKRKKSEKSTIQKAALPVLVVLGVLAVIVVTVPTAYVVASTITQSSSQTVNGSLFITGSVGIGTTTPTTDLHVRKPSAKITIDNTNADLLQGIFLKNPADTWSLVRWGNEFAVRNQNTKLFSLVKNGDATIAPTGKFVINAQCIAIKDYNATSYTYCKTYRGTLTCSARPC